MLFGGVRPYRDRIDKVAQTIIHSNADIICLQEVFSPNANVELFVELRPHFAHFYTKIGPKVVGFNKDNKGIPSGLFVASRYRLENPKFIPYTPNEQTPRSRAYGFFTADIYNDQVPLAHLITTHLQPGSDPDDRNYRAKQMAAVRSDMKQSPLPALACGDFNIEENSEEAKQLLEGFVMNKTPGWTCRELRDFWFKAHQDTDLFNARLDVESIDCFFADLKGTGIAFQTAIGIVNDVNHPEQALSDHQYEITTTVTFPNNNQ
jgi:endonuclease/exonuclease/phosphatase family metal-dependent hydrolase